MKKIILGFTLVSILFLVACGGNSYQNEIDEAVKIMNDEGHTNIKKDNSSFYVYDKGNIIMIDDNHYKRYIVKQEDGEYSTLRSSKAEKLITSPSDTDYAEKNGKEIKK